MLEYMHKVLRCKFFGFVPSVWKGKILIMKRLVIGILAHVDSGKTTLSEGLLYNAGEISRQGRVDHKDAFLDNDTIERERGITIFSHQATINLTDAKYTLLDTPGHVDFSAETERTLRVLDYAILVISGTQGVQSHTETLWRLLEHYNIPTFVFINKMDLAGAERDRVLSDISKRLSSGCFDFSVRNEDFFENAAMHDEKILEEYMNSDSVSDNLLREAILSRKIFPCYFGSALKNEGVAEFLKSFDYYTIEKKYPKDFGAKVFKITEDDKGQRLTHMKITGGSLKVKTLLTGEGWAEKANELRIYSGVKYKSVQEVTAGEVCAVAGLSKTVPGMGLGAEPQSSELMSEPVFSYSLKLEPDADIHATLAVLKRLEEEETQLHIIWNKQLQKIDIQIMGEVQLEVLKRILFERFGLNVEFEHGSIIYKETIANTVEGVGHYEPLRHYAEVHLLIEPAERGSGIALRSNCSEDILDKNWQRLILTHLAEKTHLGVLTGSPITDIRITLVNGRAHQKHTEGGDFRQATYRAVRQGLMQAESILLEPWYSFLLILPLENVGKAMTDLQQMGAEFDAPITSDELSELYGKAPISAIRDYQREVTAYTRGKGRLSCSFAGYAPCKNQEEIIREIGYYCDGDTDNTADSVFCSHGSGFVVKWDKVFDYMHIEALKTKEEQKMSAPRTKNPSALIADEEELLRIFEKTYGKIQRRSEGIIRTHKEAPEYKAKPVIKTEQYLLIDGYNIIHAWEDLRKISEESLEDARTLLIDRICSYKAMRKENVILVFDAYRVKGTVREIETINGINVVYTKEAETADSYIEKTSRRLAKHYRVRVATSDGIEQMIIFGNGAERVTPSELLSEVECSEEEVREFIRENSSH